MKTICPNLSNAEVKQQFEELVDVLGEDTAYYIWQANNGNSLDYAPNGAQSKLFSDLLDYYKGDRTKAIKEKAKLYSNTFISKFGDWLAEDTENISNLLDENGEPFIQNINIDTFNTEVQGTRQALEQKLNELRSSYDFNNQEKIDDQLYKLRQSLKDKIQIKLKTLDISDPQAKAEAEANLKYLITQLDDENINNLFAINQFIKLVNGDLPDIAQEILDAYNGNKTMSDDRIISLDRNYFGFYSPIIDEIENIIRDLDKFDDIRNTDLFKNIKDLTRVVSNVIKLSRNHLHQMQTENFKRIMIESNIDSNNEIWLGTINEFINGEILETNKDISVLTRLFMSPDKVNDPALKTLYSLLQTSQNNRRSRVFQKSVEINKLFSKVKGGLSQFYEKDENGKPTGELIREKKYGLFNTQFANFMQKLRIQHGMQPSDLGSPSDPLIRASFNKKKNEFLSHRVERPYTNEFYELIESMCPEAQAARETIQIKIRTIQDKYRDSEGKIDESKYTDEDKETMQTLRIQKGLLKSRYYSDGSLKTGIDLQIAEDLQRVDKALGEDYVVRKDKERFDKINEQMKKSLSEEEYNKWYNANTKVQYTEEFRKELDKLDKERYGEEYARLSNIRREMLAPYRDQKTNSVIASKIPAITKNYIDRLDRLMYQERLKAIKKNKSLKDTNGLFKLVASEEYEKEKKEAMKQATVNGTFDESIFEAIFYLKTSYRTNKGWQPKSYYLKLIPVNPDYLERVPNDTFNQLDPKSKFYNKNYDRTRKEYYQPKAYATEDFVDENGKKIKKGDKLYDNSTEYNKVMSNKDNKDFYNAIVDILTEANSYYYNKKFTNNYQLPQIEGSMWRYMKSKGIVKGFVNKLSDTFIRRTNQDTDIKDKSVQSPDGQKLNMIPQYFTKRLDDPSIISADLLGIVMEYYDAAVNFDEKTKIKAKAETIKAILGRRIYNKTNFTGKKVETIKGTDTQLYKMADTFIDMQLYDRLNSAIKWELFGKEFDVTKIVKTLQTVGTYVNLGFNFAVAATGGFTAAYQMLVQTIVGRYYDVHDAKRAFTFFITNTFWNGIANIGNRNYKSKQLALMDEAEIGSELRTRWRNSNHNGIIMSLLRRFGFWGMSIVDYLVKGQILDAIMYNFKYVNGEFICKEDYLDKYGNTPTNRHKWMSYTSAMDAIEFKNGQLQTKNKSMQKAWLDAKHRIYNTARALASSADGQLTSLQKAQFTQNAFGGLMMMHRQYIPVVLSERWTMQRQYDPNLDRYRAAIVGTIWEYISKVYRDRKTLGWIQSAIQNYKEFRQDNATRASIKQGIVDLVMLSVVMPLVVNLMKDIVDDNDDNWWAKFLLYVTMRTKFESTSPYNLLDIINTVKNPTPLFGFTDNFQTSLVSSFKHLTDLLNITEDENLVQRGAYKDWEKWKRDLMKLTPLKNPYEQINDIDSKIRYYQTQIMGEKD